MGEKIKRIIAVLWICLTISIIGTVVYTVTVIGYDKTDVVVYNIENKYKTNDRYLNCRYVYDGIDYETKEIGSKFSLTNINDRFSVFVNPENPKRCIKVSEIGALYFADVVFAVIIVVLSKKEKSLTAEAVNA